MNLFKLACIITGADYQRALQSPSPSRVKVGALAMAMLVPTLIWIASTFMLVHIVLEHSMIASLISAVVTGFIIFTLESLIVKAAGSFWISIFRVLLGLCTALIGAVVIDEIVFDTDIDQQMELVRTEYAINKGEMAAIHYAKSHKLSELDVKVSQAGAYYKSLDSLARGEADGTIGSGKRGVDAVTQMKQSQAAVAKIDYQNLMEHRRMHGERMAALDSTTQKQAFGSFKSNSLLYRILALYQLVTQNQMMLWVYIVFTLLMFLLEFLVIILKLCWQKTALEHESEAIEKLFKDRTTRHYDGGNSALQDASHMPYVAGLLSKSNRFNTLL